MLFRVRLHPRQHILARRALGFSYQKVTILLKMEIERIINDENTTTNGVLHLVAKVLRLFSKLAHGTRPLG